MIKAVIFDFSGVIASPGYIRWVSEFIPELNNKKELYEEAFKKLDLGTYSKSEFEDFLSAESGIPKEEIWPNVLNGVMVYEGTIEIIRELKRKNKIALLSNYSHEALLEIMEKNKLFEHFEEIFISSHHGIAKPEAAFYNKIIDKLNLKPEEIVFVDDSLKNVEKANELGMVGIHFSSSEKLKTDIRDLGLI